MTLLHRLGDGVDAEAVVVAAAAAFDLGPVASYRVIDVGYEDVNIGVSADAETLVKVFARYRPPPHCAASVRHASAAIAVGVSHPRFLRPTGAARDREEPMLGHLQVANTPLLACCMERVDGPSLYEDRTLPALDEVRELARQILLLRLVPTTVAVADDRWALQHLAREYERHHHLVGADRPPIEEASRRLGTTAGLDLPWTFVHGDLVPTNILRGSDGLAIIDFGRCDTRPRIQEVAVVLAQTLIDESTGQPSEAQVQHLLGALHEVEPFTPAEELALPAYVAAVNATYVIGALATAASGEDSEENRYWLDRSRSSLDWALHAAGRITAGLD